MAAKLGSMHFFLEGSKESLKIDNQEHDIIKSSVLAKLNC